MSEPVPPRRQRARYIAELLIPILPSLLWVLLAALALVGFYGPIGELLTRSTRLKLGGAIEVEARAQFERAAERLPPKTLADSTNAQQASLARRWMNLPDRSRPYRILVAHDILSGAQPIQKAFGDLDFEADVALCPAQIESMLKQFAYDVVVSDIKWVNCPENGALPRDGVSFLKYAHAEGFSRPTVFFVLDYDPSMGTPAYAVGISNKWYDVLEFVLGTLSKNALVLGANNSMQPTPPEGRS